jgi:hypothetical protein
MACTETFLSLPCVAVLDVTLYQLASIYAHCIHEMDESSESPMLYVQFQIQSVKLSMLSLGNFMENVTNLHTDVAHNLITQHGTRMPLNICTF